MKLAGLSLLLAGTVSLAAAPAAPSKRVALVFDDGPIPEHCAQFLEIFARENIHVTFSHVGRNVEARPDLCRAVAEAGHEIINHSYTHPHLKDMERAAIIDEVAKTQSAVKAATGRAPHWFWAPFLEWNDTMADAVAAAGLRHFPLSPVRLVSSDDWNQATDAAGILRRATTGIEDRTVVLCHEFRAETLAQLPAIIAELKRQGCTFLTFSELAATLTPEQLAVAR